MPWIWTDDIARLLVERGTASAAEAAALSATPYAIQSATTDEDTILALGLGMLGRPSEGAA